VWSYRKNAYAFCPQYPIFGAIYGVCELAPHTELLYPDDRTAVVSVGEYAFRNIWSYSAVRLPETVTRIDALAFSQSGINTVMARGSKLHVVNGFAGEPVARLVLESHDIVQLTVGENAALRQDLQIAVPSNLLAAYQATYPQYKSMFISIE